MLIRIHRSNRCLTGAERSNWESVLPKNPLKSQVRGRPILVSGKVCRKNPVVGSGIRGKTADLGISRHCLGLG